MAIRVQGRRSNVAEWVGGTLSALVLTLLPAPAARADPAPGDAAPRWQEVSSRDGIAVLKNNRAMPRVWLVGRIEIVREGEALARVRGERRTTLEPARTALVELGTNPAPEPMDRELDPVESATVTRYEAGRIAVRTHTNAPAFLIVSESYFPGWEARVDEHLVPIYQADYLLRGVVVPAGTHQIEMTFHAQGAKHGAVVSLLTLAFLGALCIYHRRTTARTKAPASS